VISTYYRLAKPGIVYGNALSAIGGFFLASRGKPDLWLFVAMLIGICLIMASACVFNNYIDRDIDAHMKRTKHRPLVTGEISGPAALTYATVLGLLGVLGLLLTNVLALVIALTGFFFYVVVYGYWKRRSPVGTLVGSISGAVPPVVGYVAVVNRLDAGALILFFILAFWQMPHFYAIALFRASEYAKAHIPVLPLVRGVAATKRAIMAYTLAFVVASAALTAAGYAGITYLIVMMIAGFVWLWRGLKGFQTPDDNKWARRMFGFSLVVLLVFCTAIAVDPWLP